MGRKENKQKRNILIGSVVVIALLILGYFTIGFSIGDSVSGGATIFSIDSVQTLGDEGSTEWVIALSLNDGAEKVRGTITAEDIKKYNIGSVPASDFDVEFSLDEVSCNYNVNQNNLLVGRLYDFWIEEQCLGFACPFESVDLDDVTRKCQTEGGENCERMIDLDSLGLGSHSEWCSWFPEESNTVRPGECSTFQGTGTNVNCRGHAPYPEGCGVCQGAECTTLLGAQLPESWRGLDSVCCYETGQTTAVATDNGDWRVQHISMVPEYDVLDIGTAPSVKYNATIKVKLENGEEYTAYITEKTKVADLGPVGSVKWAGNLVGTQFCPQPAINTALLRDIDTNEYKAVKNGAGSNFQSFVDNLNFLTRIDNNYFTYTLVTPTTVNAVDPGTSPESIYSRFTALNSFYESIRNEKQVDAGYDCAFVDGGYSCETANPVIYPLLRLTVKASSVGIFTPDGKPKILGISQDPSKAVQQGNVGQIKLDPNELTKVYVGIENTGAEDDSFDVSLECPFVVSQQSNRLPVSAQGRGIAELFVSGEGLVQSCSIKAVSVSYPKNVDTKSLSLVINPVCNQYGQTNGEIVYTEYGCYATSKYPENPCVEGEFYLEHLNECIPYEDIEKDRIQILERVADEDCNRQCNGNTDCVASCLENGNVKPVCIGQGRMMKLSDFLCDYESQPNAELPQTLNGKIWMDAPVCDYVCEFGKQGIDCTDINEEYKYDYAKDRPPKATLVRASETCETCFDGIKNQDEEGVDCGGTCQETYGLDKSCEKSRAPDHCYNHIEDGDEDGRDCGGSCDFSCNEVWKPGSSTIDSGDYALIIIVILLIAGIGTIIYLNSKNNRTKRRK